MTRLLRLEEIQQTFFVRKALDQDNVLALAELYEAGTELPPIKVAAETLELIDGRHRIGALDLLNRTTVMAELVPVGSRAEMIAMAFVANYGGALKPTRADIEHTIELLLEQGLNQARIMEMIPLPKSVARKYLMNVRSNVLKRNVNRAVLAVADGGISVADAADKFGVDPDRLREEIRGKRKSRKKDFVGVKSALTNRFKSLSLRNANLVKNILVQYGDGEATEAQVEELLDAITHSIRRMAKSHEDWVKRFEQLRSDRKGQAA